MVGFLVVLELAIPLSLLLSFSLELVVFPFFAMERGKARFKKNLFILQWEEVLCDGFDLMVLDPSDRRGTDTYVSLLLRITRWGLFLHK